MILLTTLEMAQVHSMAASRLRDYEAFLRNIADMEERAGNPEDKIGPLLRAQLPMIQEHVPELRSQIVDLKSILAKLDAAGKRSTDASQPLSYDEAIKIVVELAEANGMEDDPDMVDEIERQQTALEIVRTHNGIE